MVLAVVSFDTTDPERFEGAVGTTRYLFDDVSGFRGFELHRGVENPQRFIITATWDSVGAHEDWQRLHAEEFLGVLNPYLEGPPTIEHFS